MKKGDFVYYFRRRNEGAWRGRIEQIKGNAARIFLLADNWGVRFVAPVGGRQLINCHASRLQLIGDEAVLHNCKLYDDDIPKLRAEQQKQHRAQKRKEKKEKKAA